MARFVIIAGVRFYRRSLVRLSTGERAALAASGQAVMRRSVEWPLPQRAPDFSCAYVDPGGTEIWGPGPYLKVPNRAADDEGELVNRLFCPWGYPPDRLRVSRSRSYLRIAAVALAQVAPAAWEWLLTVEPWQWSPSGTVAEQSAAADRGRR